MDERNPRFPHSFKVWRVHRDNSGGIVYDANGDVTYDNVNLDVCAVMDGIMMRDSNGKPITQRTVISLACGYRTNSRNTSKLGDVVVHNISLHTPPFSTPLLYDDILEITDYERTYKAQVVRKTLFNWGADIWFDEIKG